MAEEFSAWWICKRCRYTVAASTPEYKVLDTIEGEQVWRFRRPDELERHRCHCTIGRKRRPKSMEIHLVLVEVGAVDPAAFIGPSKST